MTSITYDPLATTLASAADIKAAREAIEALPIECTDGTILDADERSELRMRDTVDRWATFGIATIEWRLGDNTFKTMTHAELTAYYDEMLDKRAVRALTIYPEFLAYRANQATTLRDLENWKASYNVL